jgi:hypothetical protein
MFSPQKQQIELHQKAENLTEKRTTLTVSEIYTKQSVKKTQFCS